MRSKMFLIPILCIMLAFVVMNISFQNHYLLSKEGALAIGEQKYLEFLWFVDGALTDDWNYTVNDKTLTKENYPFVCKQDMKSKKCTIDDFDNILHRLFSKTITYDSVYSDGISYSWYEKQNSKFILNYDTNCSVRKMSKEQTISVIKITHDEIQYEISFDDNYSKYNLHDFDKKFVLVKEDNHWKIKNAYYHDSCHMDYYIE